MKKTLFAIILTLTGLSTFSQVSFPYFTGFDNTAQRNGWHNFRLGYLSASDWSVVAFNPFSLPNCLHHDYPVGSSDNDTTIDWFVSPQFDFSGGGSIDSMKVIVYSITGNATVADELDIYLLTVSNNPSLAATKTRLASLKGMVSSKNTWLDTGNFIIPPTNGPCFIGLRYKATNNWFVISIDNLYINGKTSSARETGLNYHKLLIYSDPENSTVTINLPKMLTGNHDLLITNSLGQKVFSKKISGNSELSKVDVSTLVPGNYIIQLRNENNNLYYARFNKSW